MNNLGKKKWRGEEGATTRFLRRGNGVSVADSTAKSRGRSKICVQAVVKSKVLRSQLLLK